MTKGIQIVLGPSSNEVDSQSLMNQDEISSFVLTIGGASVSPLEVTRELFLSVH